MTVVPTTTSASKPGSEDEDDMDDEEFEMDISLQEQARERSTGTDNAVDVSARSGRHSTFSDRERTSGHVIIGNNANDDDGNSSDDDDEVSLECLGTPPSAFRVVKGSHRVFVDGFGKRNIIQKCRLWWCRTVLYRMR